MCEECSWWDQVGAFAVDMNVSGEYLVLGVLSGGGYGLISEHPTPEEAFMVASSWAIQNDMELTIAEGVKICRKIDRKNFHVNRMSQFFKEQHSKYGNGEG